VYSKATYVAITRTYGFLTPDLWQKIEPSASPFEEFSSHLQVASKKAY
jgi:small subunit ribosomal protein S2e